MSEKRNMLYSPAGEAKWAHIHKPNTKFKADGEYSVDLALPAEEAEVFKKKIKAIYDEEVPKLLAKLGEAAKKAGKKLPAMEVTLPWYDETARSDPSNEDSEVVETGRVVFKFKNGAVIRPKDKAPINVRIDVFDSKNQPVKGLQIGRGSRLKVAFEAVPYAQPSLKKQGVSLRLKGVKVLELKSFSGGIDASGFGDDDGGFVADEATSFGDGQEGAEGNDATETDGNGDF